MIKKIFIIMLNFIAISNNLNASELINAIKNNDINKAIELIQSNKIDLNAKDNYDETALIWACYKGEKKIVRILINNNADLNIQDKYKQTALIIACNKGHQEIAKMLIESNANTNTQEDVGLTALILACQNGDKESVKMLIKASADLNVQTNSGETALMLACLYAHKEISKMLIEENANINIQNNFCQTAFLYAENQPEILSMLLRAKENRLSNCHCKNLLCNSCKAKMQILPILKTDNSNSNDYIKQVEIIINNNQITEKLAIKILDELIKSNDEKSIKLKNRLRLLSYTECQDCNALACRECKINERFKSI